MRQALQIRYGGATIYGAPDWVSLPGLYVGREGFKGWDDGVNASRSEKDPRPLAWGNFTSEVYPGERVVTISGWALAESEGELEAYRDQIMGAGVGELATVTVQLRGVVRWARGTVISSSFTDTGSRRRILKARFEVQLELPDPRKYGDLQTFAAGQALYHRGNTDAWPVITVTGPFPSGYTITYAGHSFVVTAALASGARHVIDMAEGWVRNPSGVVIHGAVSVADTFSVPKGLQSSAATISGGAGSMSIAVTDTYI